MFVEHETLVACGNVSGLKAYLKTQHESWDQIELRLIVNGRVVPDEEPVDPEWCAEAGSMAAQTQVVAMALRQKQPVEALTAPTQQQPTQQQPVTYSSARGTSVSAEGTTSQNTTPRGSRASRIAALRQQRAQERADSRQATPRGDADRTAAFAALGGGGLTCQGCGKICFVAERATSTPHGLVFHKACFACATCGKMLGGGAFELALNDQGTEGYYCPAHARQRRAEVGNAQEMSAAAAAATRAGGSVSADSPLCVLCNEPVSKNEQWDASTVLSRLDAHPRWSRTTLTFHTGCGGCFKCAAKGALEVDLIGGIYCDTHYKQRVQAAGGPVRASDALALQKSEAMFVRPALQPPQPLHER